MPSGTAARCQHFAMSLVFDLIRNRDFPQSFYTITNFDQSSESHIELNIQLLNVKEDQQRVLVVPVRIITLAGIKS